MKHAARGVIAALLLSQWLLSPAYAQSRPVRPVNVHALHDGPTERLYFHSYSDNERELLALRARLVALGARNVNCFLPSVIVCDFPLGEDAGELVGGSGIAVLREHQVGEARPSRSRFDPGWVKACYASAEALRREAQDRAARPRPQESAPAECGLIISDPTVPAAMSSVSDRLVYQNAEFMVGTIVVNVVFPESEGAAENWTGGWMASAMSAAVSSCIHYQQFFSSMPLHFIYKKFESAPTALEPIAYTTWSDSLWISDVMAGLGHAGTPSQHMLLVHEFNDQLRLHSGADWAFTAFVVNARNDPDHMFDSARFISYGHLGGPYFCIPYPPGNGGDFQFGQAFKHEMGHTFWALEENQNANNNCQSSSGYLNRLHKNKLLRYDHFGNPVGCQGMPMMCVMNVDHAMDFWVSSVCDHSAGMMGLVDDTPRNRVPDVFDNPPHVGFENAAVETVFTSGSMVRARITSVPVENTNAQQTGERAGYAAPLKSATYSINDVGVIQVLPVDGVWDGIVEDVEISVDRFIPGAFILSLTIRNTFGASSGAVPKEIYYVALRYLQYTKLVREDGIELKWDMSGETFGALFDLHRTGTDGVDSVVASGLTADTGAGQFSPVTYFDQDVSSGGRYEYYLEGSFDFTYRGQTQTHTYISPSVAATAMLPMAAGSVLSEPAPNPFQESSTISLSVPPSCENCDSPYPLLVPTAYDVTVFDVLGRRVKTLSSGGVYAQVLTFTWDGTNENNEKVPTGVYFIRASAGPSKEAKKVLLIH